MTGWKLLVGPGASKCDLLSLAIGIEVVVDELAAVVRVQPQKREWQAPGDVMHSATHSLLAFTPYPLALYPARGRIYSAQGGEIEALGALSAVGHQASS